MPTKSTNPAYIAGKKDFNAGKERNPDQYTHKSRQSYWDGYNKAKIKFDKENTTGIPAKPNNPVAHCATCLKPRRQKAFKIYDGINDVFFCDEVCEEARKDRE